MTRFSIGVPIVLTLASLMLVGCPKVEMVASPVAMVFSSVYPTGTLTVTNASTGWFGMGSLGVTVTVTTDKPWLTVTGGTFTLPDAQGKNSKDVTVSVAYAKSTFSEGTVTVAAKTVEGNAAAPVSVPVTTGVAQYLTEPFDPNLEGKMIIFSEVNVPEENTLTFYNYRSEIADLPSGVDANMRVNLDDYFDERVLLVNTDPVAVLLLDSKNVWLYGQGYDTVYVGTDGRITFENTEPAATPADADALLAGHFAKAGVSALYTPFSIEGDGEVYAIQFEDRLLLVYNGMPVDGVAESSNSFQVEFFFEEPPAVKLDTTDIQRGMALSWFSVDDDITAVVGLSAGGDTAVPDDYEPTDLVTVSTITDNTYPLPPAL